MADPFTNEDLTAYLDDEVGSDVKKKIEAALPHNRELAKRLDALALNKPALTNAFDGLLGAAPAYTPMPMAVSTTASSVQKALPANRFAYAAAGLLLGVAGWAGTTFYQTNQAQNWQQQAAIYHSLYVASTLNQIQNDNTKMSVELSRVSAALGKDLKLGDLSGVEQLEYKRSQILGFEGRPLAQIAYLSKLGTPIVLCIMKDGQKSDAPVSARSLQGMSAATWRKGEFEYLLIGGTDGDLISKAAEQFSATL